MTEPRPFRARLVWDADSGEIRDGAVRYMLIRPDALMSVFTRLDPETRRTTLAAFGEAVHEFGARSAATYARASAEPLIAIVARTAPDLGWGRWSVDAGENGTVITVENSPFARGVGTSQDAVCAPIAGMVSAVLGIMNGTPVPVRETDCAAMTPGSACRFESARPRSTGG